MSFDLGCNCVDHLPVVQHLAWVITAAHREHARETWLVPTSRLTVHFLLAGGGRRRPGPPPISDGLNLAERAGLACWARSADLAMVSRESREFSQHEGYFVVAKGNCKELLYSYPAAALFISEIAAALVLDPTRPEYSTDIHAVGHKQCRVHARVEGPVAFCGECCCPPHIKTSRVRPRLPHPMAASSVEFCVPGQW